MRTVVRNIKTIVNVLCDRSEKKRFDETDQVEITTSGSGSRLAILTENGIISDFGEEECMLSRTLDPDNIIDCNGGCVIPGLIDAHTHPVWAGDRLHEFTLKLKGASYMEIHESGGGINYTVSKTSAADEATLYNLLRQRLLGMIRKGTTTVECKTGYGLYWAVEEKLLRVLNRAKMELPIDISITFLSAHSVPKDTNASDFTEHIVSEQIPKVKDLIQEKFSVDNIDVFCEKGVYDIEQSAKILQAGKSIGLNLNFHADELSDTGGAELAGRLGARAASHLEEASPAGVAAMAASGTAAVLLPTTAHLLRLRPPSARAIIQAGVPVALGTDFNPNAYCLSMPIVMYLACTTLGMTPEEALAGATINAAYSLNMSDRVGAITVGRQADIVVLKCDRWENIIYQFGEAESLITHVIKKGKLIFSQETGFVGL
ncbi:hypothetical protein CRM22_004313 [Opisthorchis felineus]|uniref:Probable imidazolonepropionase n=1 Tax=Opisthorchis felineus TaxID=147828 RepID=A0A4V3SFG8_OPIFE|nr:hypothetical protein CRM22_004313 [Opisthorchis felineus]